MTAHELARKLLAGPDILVLVPEDQENSGRFNNVVSFEHYVYEEYATDFRLVNSAENFDPALADLPLRAGAIKAIIL